MTINNRGRSNRPTLRTRRTAFTLVEEDTVVGDVTLSAGELLLGHSGNRRNVIRFEPGDLGANTTGTLSLLLRGDNINIGQDVAALELIEQDRWPTSGRRRDGRADG